MGLTPEAISVFTHRGLSVETLIANPEASRILRKALAYDNNARLLVACCLLQPYVCYRTDGGIAWLVYNGPP